MSDWARLGDLLTNAKQPAEAAQAYDRALALSGGDKAQAEVAWPLLLQEASALLDAGDWPGAKAKATRALALAPQEPAVLNFLGYSQIEHGDDVAGATALIAQASKLAPDDPAITDSLGWSWYLRGDLVARSRCSSARRAARPPRPTSTSISATPIGRRSAGSTRAMPGAPRWSSPTAPSQAAARQDRQRADRDAVTDLLAGRNRLRQDQPRAARPATDARRLSCARDAVRLLRGRGRAERGGGGRLSLAIEGPFGAGLSGGADNLVLRAAEALRAATGTTAGAAIRLDKRLPVASGIGGGSADAAAALRLLVRLWDVEVPPETLHAIAAALGADVPGLRRVARLPRRGAGRRARFPRRGRAGRDGRAARQSACRGADRAGVRALGPDRSRAARIRRSARRRACRSQRSRAARARHAAGDRRR